MICEVFDTDEASCVDRSPSGGRSEPPADDVDPDLQVTDVIVDGEWTTVTFLRTTSPLDEQDYDLKLVRGLWCYMMRFDVSFSTHRQYMVLACSNRNICQDLTNWLGTETRDDCAVQVAMGSNTLILFNCAK